MSWKLHIIRTMFGSVSVFFVPRNDKLVFVQCQNQDKERPKACLVPTEIVNKNRNKNYFFLKQSIRNVYYTRMVYKPDYIMLKKDRILM